MAEEFFTYGIAALAVIVVCVPDCLVVHCETLTPQARVLFVFVVCKQMVHVPEVRVERVAPGTDLRVVEKEPEGGYVYNTQL